MSTEITEPLSDLAEVNPRVDVNGLRGDTLVSFIPMSDVSDSGQWIGRQVRRLDEVRVGYTPFVEDDVLFAKITPCMENGKGAHATGLRNGLGFGSTEFHVLRARGDNDPRFLFHWLQAGVTRTKAIAYMGGSAGQQRVQADFFSFFRIPRINPREQSRIAAVLDKVDEAIAKTEAVISKLKQVRAGLLQDLLTRGLDENGQLRDPVAHPEQFQDSPLGRIPRVWSIETLGERLKQNSGTIQTGPFGSQLHAHEYRAEGIPVIMPQDIRGGDFDDTQIARIPVTKAEELRRHRVRRGDLIFARRGDLSRCVAVGEREVGWLCGTGCLLMRFEQLNLSPRWLSLAYRHDFGQRQIAARAVGTTMVNLNTTLLAHLVFAFPRKQEQEDIVRRIDEADATIQKEQANVLKLGLLKSGLMNDLLTGCVRVPEGIAVTG